MTSVPRFGCETEAVNMNWETEGDDYYRKLAGSASHMDEVTSESEEHDCPASAPKSGTAQVGLSTGPELSELYDEIDLGYDADVEHVFPDGYEDASDTNAETKQPEDPDKDEDEENVPRQVDLVHRFRRLNCERQSTAQRKPHARNDSGGSSLLKRSHSAESLTDTEDEAVPDNASPTSTSSQRRTRKRVVPSRSRAGVSASPSPDHMDIDIQEPSSARIGQDK